MQGRRPVGPELAEQLEGSALACQRMRVILETLAGTRRVKNACADLGICQQRFETLRTTAIQAGIEALELKPAGRPVKVVSEAEAQIAQLQKRVAELEAELAVTLIRAELAIALPQVGANAGKKARPRSSRARKSNQSRPGISTKR
jgi:ABC-type uncharacterized transport system permease subunit